MTERRFVSGVGVVIALLVGTLVLKFYERGRLNDRCANVGGSLVEYSGRYKCVRAFVPDSLWRGR